MQLHINQGEAALYSKNGTDYTKRFSALRDMIEAIRPRMPSSIALRGRHFTRVICGSTYVPSSIASLGSSADQRDVEHQPIDLLHLEPLA